MPTIGWFEILLILAVAIIVVGPKDFPIMLKKVGSWVGSIKKYINDIQSEVSQIDSKIIDTEIEDKDNQKKDNE